MHPHVAALFARPHGLALRREVVRAGLAAHTVDELVRHGRWVAVRRGVYTTADRWAALDEWTGRPLAQAWAASLNMSQPHVLSHESAALAHGMAILRPPAWTAHITRFGVQGTRLRHGVCHHLAPFEPDQIVDVAGIPTLDPARTALDIARHHGMGLGAMRYAVVACDAALRVGATRRDLERALRAMRSWAHVTVAREAVALADAGAESPAESLARLLVGDLGLGPVETQFGLRDGRRTAYADLRIGRHLVEVDGRVKYERDGHPSLAVVWEEKRREDWFRGYRLGMSRVGWEDLVPSAWEATSRRLYAEVAATHERYGTDVSDLAAYRVARRVA